jgi:hypothetical protein
MERVKLRKPLLQKAFVLATQITIKGVHSNTNDVDARSTTSTTPKEHDKVERQHNRKEKFNLGQKLSYLNKSLSK